MITYKLVTNSSAILKYDDSEPGVEYCIPADPTNTDWKTYQDWLAADPANQPSAAD